MEYIQNKLQKDGWQSTDPNQDAKYYVFNINDENKYLKTTIIDKDIQSSNFNHNLVNNINVVTYDYFEVKYTVKYEVPKDISSTSLNLESNFKKYDGINFCTPLKFNVPVENGTTIELWYDIEVPYDLLPVDSDYVEESTDDYVDKPNVYLNGNKSYHIYLNKLGVDYVDGENVSAIVSEDGNRSGRLYTFGQVGWVDTNQVATVPGDNNILCVGKYDLNNGIIEAKGIPYIDDINDFISKKSKEFTNYLLEEMGFTYCGDLEQINKTMLCKGAVSGIDDNLFFGVVKWSSKKHDVEKNYEFMVGKASIDAYFVATYVKASVKSDAEIPKKLAEFNALTSLAIVSTETGIGVGVGAAAEAAAVKSLCGAIKAKLISAITEHMGKRSAKILNADTAKLLKVATNRASSYLLGRNLGSKPSYPCAAHHIVPGTHKLAKRAQDILKDLGININSAINGVWLPTVTGTSAHPATVHSGSHIKTYVEATNKAVVDAYNKGGNIDEKRKNVVEAIDKIRHGLLEGKIKLNH